MYENACGAKELQRDGTFAVLYVTYVMFGRGEIEHAGIEIAPRISG